MTIYVDNMRGDARVGRGGRTVRGPWSHLLADDAGELAAFAAGLGLRLEWLQAPGTPGEHYDIVEGVRRRAVAAGAVPISYPLGTGNVIATKRLHAAALDAAGRGWHVFPLRPGTKVPAVRHWEHEATTDTAQIKELWTADLRRRDWWHVPEPRNVGIACGPSKLVVLDLDLAKPGQDRTSWEERWRDRDVGSGAEVLDVLAEQAGQNMPETYVVATPSGGRHLYFSAPEDVPVRNSAGHLGPMIDVRGQGGYVVAVGSRLHPQPDQDDAPLEAGGLAYRLVHDLPVALLPGWLADATAADRQRDDGTSRDLGPQRVGDRPLGGPSDSYGAAALRGEADRVRSAPVGQRNHTLNAAAYSLGQLVGAGALDQARAVETLTEAAQTAGLQAAETAATIDSGLTAGARMPRVVQPPQARTSREGAQADPAVDQQTSGTGRHSDDKDALAALDRAFDQSAAVAVETATRLVTDAAPDQRPALLREAATHIARLIDVERIDGQSALDALTAAADRVGMARTEVDAAINAGFAQRRDTVAANDHRPPPPASGPAVAQPAAYDRLQLDSADPAREGSTAARTADDLDPEDRAPQPAAASSARSDRAEPRPGQGVQGAAVAPVGTVQPVSGEEPGNSPRAALESSDSVDAGAPETWKAKEPYRIAEIDAAYAGWLFAEAWSSWSKDRNPCHPADTLRIACEWEGLPTLGKEDRRFGPRRPAPFIPAPGEELVDREVWESWPQSQRDDWYFTRQERAQAVAFRPRWHRENREAPSAHEADARDGSAAAAPETARAEHRAAEPALDQPVDADALVRALLGVLQTRGAIDRAAWDATVKAVAERSAAPEAPDEAGREALDKPGVAAGPDPAREETRAPAVGAAWRQEPSSHVDAAPVDADEGAKPRPEVDIRPQAGHDTDRPRTDPSPGPGPEPLPGRLGSLKAEVPPSEATDAAPDPHVLLDEAVGQARTALSHLEASRAAPPTSRDEAADAALRNDRTSYWAEPQVEL